MSDFEAVFLSLRQIMLAQAGDLSVTRDAPGALVVRTTTVDPKTGEPGWFGTVTIKKSYVAYHLTAVYDHMELMQRLPPELERRRQGKTCFNFRVVDEAVLRSLSTLTGRVREAVV